MNLRLSHLSKPKKAHITISGSKSETNRLLLLQALFPEISIENISDSDDSVLMQKALENSETIINIHHSGTAMRFLTAYFSIQENREVILTGSSRMKERPIGILVEALKSLGATIEYLENPGFPPLKIIGKELTNNKISISAQVSSQYISALMLIAPKLPNGLEITLKDNITSRPYIEMTLALLNQLGIKTSFVGNIIKISSKSNVQPIKFIVESDWSSASYYYSIVALSEVGTEITLSSFKENSLQADKVLVDIYKDLGVDTTFENTSIILKKYRPHTSKNIVLDLTNSPDIAQTITVTCFGLGISCELNGLHTLKIKETDRLTALKNEIEKLGGKLKITGDSLTLENNSMILDSATIATYQDHRMAMAFAPLALKTNLIIEEAEVVSKSYPNFWEDLKKLGFRISEI
jgi:3-phosphoshikimate 1-carboxyvinyltransferase